MQFLQKPAQRLDSLAHNLWDRCERGLYANTICVERDVEIVSARGDFVSLRGHGVAVSYVQRAQISVLPSEF